jgi:hypothetical protein
LVENISLSLEIHGGDICASESAFALSFSDRASILALLILIERDLLLSPLLLGVCGGNL